ncbi:PIN domain-containing protein [Thermococcus sp.]
MRVLLDTNVLYNYLFETPLTGKATEILLRAEELYVSTTVLNELHYSVMRRKAEKELGITSYRKLKEFLAKEGYGPFHEDFKAIEETLNLLEVLTIPDSQNWGLIKRLMFGYSLLPNDATILATCIEHGLDALATFDNDYRKVQEVKILP